MAIYTVASSTVANSTLGRTLARAPDGRLWAVYLKSAGGYNQVFAAYSDNGGQTWTEEQVTAASGNQALPTLAVNSLGEVIVAWTGQGWGTNTTYNNIQYRKRTTSWQTQEAITDIANTQTSPSIALGSSGNVHVVWSGLGWGTNTAYYNIQYRKRTTSWQTQEAITDVANTQTDPSIALGSSGNVHVVWSGPGWGTNTGVNNIQYRKRTTSWQTQEAITDVASKQYLPSIVLDSSDNVHVAWTGRGWGTNTLRYNIQYRKRTTAWQTQEAVTDVASHQSTDGITFCGLSIALDSSDNVHLAWTGLGWGTNTAYYNIQYRKRTTSWQTQEGLTDTASDQQWPHLIWALHPTVSGTKTNVPSAGYAFTWDDTGAAATKIYLSADLAWPSGLAYQPRPTAAVGSPLIF
ncbi:MAG: exo-alpha-sialidase [Actinobacteria bacterium]|nr:MAG: exo-alpha-sialidase [Actinomycetota bacterium]